MSIFEQSELKRELAAAQRRIALLEEKVAALEFYKYTPPYNPWMPSPTWQPPYPYRITSVPNTAGN